VNIFVGNLSFKATETDVRKLFEEFGSVTSVKIVMEKQGRKSRGFGFVDMPDEQAALAAIGALNGKEFMGRPVNVSPARPKPQVRGEDSEAKKIRPEIALKSQGHPKEEGQQKGSWYRPVFNKEKSRYKIGRRSRSFMKRRAASGIAQEAMPKQESNENPMRWRKRHKQPKPWQKRQGEHKPSKKAEGDSRPWKKVEGGPRPWKKKEGECKPWRKKAGKSKPWRNSGKRPRPRQSQIQSRRKPGGYTR